MAEQVKKGRVGRAPKELLQGFGVQSAEAIWTNVPLARVVVALAFILVFTTGTGSLTAFALQDHEQVP